MVTITKRGTYNIVTGVYTSPTGVKTSTATPPPNTDVVFVSTRTPFVSNSSGSSRTATSSLPQSTLETPTEAVKPLNRTIGQELKAELGRTPTDVEIIRERAKRIRELRQQAGTYGRNLGYTTELSILNQYMKAKPEIIERRPLEPQTITKGTKQVVRGQKVIDAWKSFLRNNPRVTKTAEFVSGGLTTYNQIGREQAKINKRVDTFNSLYGTQEQVDALTESQYKKALLEYKRLTAEQEILDRKTAKLNKKFTNLQDTIKVREYGQRDILGNPLNYITGTSSSAIFSNVRAIKSGKKVKVGVAFTTKDGKISGVAKGLVLSYDKGKKAFILSRGRLSSDVRTFQDLVKKRALTKIYSFAQKGVAKAKPLTFEVRKIITSKDGKNILELRRITKYPKINYQTDIGQVIVKKGLKFPKFTKKIIAKFPSGKLKNVARNYIQIKLPSGKVLKFFNKEKYIRGVGFEFMKNKLINGRRMSLLLGKSSSRGLFKDKKDIVAFINQLQKAKKGKDSITFSSGVKVRKLADGTISIQRGKGTKLTKQQVKGVQAILTGIAKAVTKVEQQQRRGKAVIKAGSILGSNVQQFGKLINPPTSTAKAVVKSVSRKPKVRRTTSVSKATLNTKALAITKQLQKAKQKVGTSVKSKQQIVTLQKQNAKLKQQIDAKSVSQTKLKEIQRSQFRLAQKIVPILKTKPKIPRVPNPRTQPPRIPRIPIPYAYIKGKRRRITSIPKGYVLGYNVYGKVGNKFVKVNKKPLKKFDSLSKGSYIVDRTTSKQFKVVPVGYYKIKDLGTLLKRERGYFTKTKPKFREYKIQNKKRKFTELKYVEKRKYFKDATPEKKNISLLQYVKGGKR